MICVTRFVTRLSQYNISIKNGDNYLDIIINEDLRFVMGPNEGRIEPLDILKKAGGE